MGSRDKGLVSGMTSFAEQDVLSMVGYCLHILTTFNIVFVAIL